MNTRLILDRYNNIINLIYKKLYSDSMYIETIFIKNITH